MQSMKCELHERMDIMVDSGASKQVVHHPSCFRKLWDVDPITVELGKGEKVTTSKCGMFYITTGRNNIVSCRTYYILTLKLSLLSCARSDYFSVTVTFQKGRCNFIDRRKNGRVNWSISRRSSDRLYVAKIIPPPQPI